MSTRKYTSTSFNFKSFYCRTFTPHVILKITLQYLAQDNQLIITDDDDDDNNNNNNNNNSNKIFITKPQSNSCLQLKVQNSLKLRILSYRDIKIMQSNCSNEG